ncbi:hypothetical protein QOM21_20750 [Streptomyces sp. Pv4-95]|uniref:hypothetical protein n=1 Tax=Streptomyces sp. Pv4-95 TaxID=3049543 RepID=UPI003892BD78
MNERTRIRRGFRRGTRVAVAAGLVLATVAVAGGCARGHSRGGFIGGIGGGSDHTVSAPSYSYSPTPDPYETPTYEPSYSPSPTLETFDPDGRSDVDGSGCDYSESLRQFSYTVSVTNPSTSDTFSYDMAVNWMKAKPADGKAYGLHQRSIVVGPGDTETYTARYTINQASVGQFWFTCQITRAQKTRM